MEQVPTIIILLWLILLIMFSFLTGVKKERQRIKKCPYCGKTNLNIL